MLVNEVVERLVVLLVVVVQLLQFHVAVAHLFQSLVVLVLNRLGLHLQQKLVESPLFLIKFLLERLDLVLDHGQFLVVVWQEVLQQDLLYLNPSLVFVHKSGVEYRRLTQEVTAEVETGIRRKQG